MRDDIERVCERCGGRGSRCYPDTSTWIRSYGGQAITNDVCDLCWGSGDEVNKWTDLRAWCERIKTAEHRVTIAREVLERFVAWASPPTTGMGAGIHCETFPSLTPAAKKEMLFLAETALKQLKVDK